MGKNAAEVSPEAHLYARIKKGKYRMDSMGHHRVKGYLWYVYPNRIVEVIK